MTDNTAYGNREIADLLPWYENGRLDAADKRRVEAALATDPALRRELALVREEMSATVTVNRAQGAPSRQAIDRFFTALDGGERAAPRRFSLMRFINERVEALQPRTMAWGAMAACVLVLLQAGVIVHLASSGVGSPDEQRASYHSASVGNDIVATGPILLVAFEPNASAGSIQKLLEDNGLSVVSGPAAGYFSVRINSDVTSADDMIARLNERRDVVVSVVLQSPPD